MNNELDELKDHYNKCRLKDIEKIKSKFIKKMK